MKRHYIFNVDRARQLAGDGRPPVEVDEESVRSSVAESEIDEAHIDHVDPDPPGIIAHVFYRLPEGELLRGHVLIDGHHRAARCLRDGRAFSAYVLNETESLSVLQRRPECIEELSEPEDLLP